MINKIKKIENLLNDIKIEYNSLMLCFKDQYKNEKLAGKVELLYDDKLNYILDEDVPKIIFKDSDDDPVEVEVYNPDNIEEIKKPEQILDKQETEEKESKDSKEDINNG